MNKNFYHTLNEKFLIHKNQICIEETSGRQWSYQKINDLAGRFSSLLDSLGILKGSRVIAQLEKSVFSIALYLGCLKSGIIYIPLNTAYTSNEISYFIKNTEPDLLILSPDKYTEHDALLSNLKELKSISMGNSSEDNLIRQIIDTDNNLDIVDLEEDDIASIIFTSGTTGHSKGAIISHKNLSSNAISLNKIWGFTYEDVLLHALPVYHVHGLFVALHCAFLSGCKIFFFEKFSPGEIVNYLKFSTVMMGVPTFYSRLLSNDQFDKEVCKNMRVFISGSAPLTDKVFLEFYERTKHRILERYGMSETGMITSNPLNGERIEGTVGYSLPDVKIRENKESGIIEVKGPNVFKGYWGMEEKTKDEFTEDGFFITGDIGKIDDDGRLTLFGRSSDMIISGGYNIYPKEIELVIDEIEGIKESAVIGCPESDLGEAVVAILVSDIGIKTIPDDTISEILLKSLANYKCPRKYIWMEDLPRNAMGKVQKKSLRNEHKNIFGVNNEQ